MRVIERPLYVEKIRPYMGKSLIKVLVGQRRVGKSFVLMQLRNIVEREHPQTKIIYINKELHEFGSILDAESFLNYIKPNDIGAENVAVFVDEIQDIAGFESVLRDLAARGNYDIYCTGSNANLLSGELASYLSGRYVEINIHALSFVEYINFNGLENSNETFQKYLVRGGLPYLINLSDDLMVVQEYQRNIYNSILLKDVVARFGVRNVPFLENLVLFVADNLGSIVSSKKISDYLKSQRINISPQVVLDYLGYLQASFIIQKVKRSGIEGKRIFEVGEKYYFADLGLRNALVGYKPTDINKLLENIVYLHLRIAGYSVTVGVDGEKEVDFIAVQGSKKIYVQVAYLLLQPETVEREFSNLMAIPDNYPKYVVTMDQLAETGTFKGIERVNVRGFCTILAS